MKYQCLIYQELTVFLQLKRLLLQVLHFTALLIEHSFSRHLYNSMEHLTSLLASCDMTVVLEVLNLLFVFRYDQLVSLRYPVFQIGWGYRDHFPNFSIKTFILTPIKNRHMETVLMRGHNTVELQWFEHLWDHQY